MEKLIYMSLAISALTALLVAYLIYRTIFNTKKDSSTSVFVDTSVLIDARIVSIAKTGFIPGKLIIPRSVIGELQFMADHADNDKRAKARRGLDVIKELQEIEEITVEIFQDGSRASEGVDERLLKLAKERGGFLCTIDYNLNKVAQVEGIQVLNVNELAQQIRIVYLPGDIISLQLTQKGQDGHQAVGHLEDGTMVVVEQSSSYIGKTVEVSVVRSLQTAAGRMIFAKRINKDNNPKGKQSNKFDKSQRTNSNDRVDKQAPAVTSRPSIVKKPVARLKQDRLSRAKNHQNSSRRKSTSDSREQELINLVDNQS